LHRRSGLVVPPQLLPLALRQLLLPRPWRERVSAAATRYRLDPAQLYAVMRAGSGFEPRALSPWGGRGLLLVDSGDGERLAAEAGLPAVRPEDLFDPRVAIPVGGARMAELAALFPGRPHLALAAHLSGPAQARLWASWCETDEPAELLTKVGAADMRAVLVQVLTAQAAYSELYGE
jgi:soluble lytic murein transglycosylase-like protein